ncbi:hypothetical protein [Lysinibacillus fusiformis]|uniref:hypothetical protein n=1 Tax=Lysinibacillus fusiformis TaxID=28031 RepID=UPI000469DE10|nr:hypothetical protein [Lysinibacillus fusiformis]
MPSIKQSIGRGKNYSKDNICFLISSKITVDELFQQIEITVPEMVYCAVSSIGQNEFSVSMQNGLKARLTIIVDYDEYDGETQVEYNRQVYSVYRTFVRDDGDIELYCEVKIGG